MVMVSDLPRPLTLALKLTLGALGLLVGLDHLHMLMTRALVNLGEFGRPVSAASVPALARVSRWGLLPRIRWDATRLLGVAPGEAADEALRERLHDTSDATLWGVALSALRRAEDAEALAVARPGLIGEAFDAEVGEARRSAAFAAGALGDPTYAPRCAAALGDETVAVRIDATRCLARLGPAEQLPALQSLADRETSVSVLRELVDLAVQLDAPEAPALFQTAAARLIAEGSPELAAKALARGTAPWCAAYAHEAAQAPPTGAP